MARRVFVPSYILWAGLFFVCGIKGVNMWELCGGLTGVLRSQAFLKKPGFSLISFHFNI
jgi:hypothetical protein